MTPKKRNQVFTLINPMRNRGGDVIIFLAGAMTNREHAIEGAARSERDFVQSADANVVASEPCRELVPAALSAPDALDEAYGLIYAGLQARTQTLA